MAQFKQKAPRGWFTPSPAMIAFYNAEYLKGGRNIQPYPHPGNNGEKIEVQQGQGGESEGEESEEEEFRDTYEEYIEQQNTKLAGWLDGLQRVGLATASETEDEDDEHELAEEAELGEGVELSDEYENEEGEATEVELLKEDEGESRDKYIWKLRQYPSGGGKTKPGETVPPANVWRITRISRPTERQPTPDYEDSQQLKRSPSPDYEDSQQLERSPSPDYEDSQQLERSPSPDYEDSQQQERSPSPQSTMNSTISNSTGSLRPKRRRVDSEDDEYSDDDNRKRARAKRAKIGGGSKRYVNRNPPSKAKDVLPRSASRAKIEPKVNSKLSAEGNATQGEPDGPKPKKKNGAWSEDEHDALYQLIKAQREYESENPTVKRLRDENLYNAMSAKLKEMGIDRSPSAAKNYWNRHGRALSEFDERIGVKINTSLTTSAQVPKCRTKTT
ncbi:uncharacterized protein BP5553_00360 [Venustampulla echinocandica]|uniref:Myb-like domain-containing protein n=1 Tax=Venustampulla echinocandica TaxID=2656787 RepID=A0A370TXZ4_9HELO|nr:uncharacterized protein BP5553_00360 [Venustampulla echinocandica]RDL40381.1 hypothetical protein BP5553_00360 [Venustampulla echinocandica]